MAVVRGRIRGDCHAARGRRCSLNDGRPTCPRRGCWHRCPVAAPDLGAVRIAPGAGGPLAMLAHAADLHAPRVVASMQLLPFADSTFDVVMSAWVIETVDNPGAAAAEMLRVLRPGGALVYSFCSRPMGRLNRWRSGPTRAVVHALFAGHFLRDEQTPFHDGDISQRSSFAGGAATVIVLGKCCTIDMSRPTSNSSTPCATTSACPREAGACVLHEVAAHAGASVAPQASRELARRARARLPCRGVERLGRAQDCRRPTGPANPGKFVAVRTRPNLRRTRRRAISVDPVAGRVEESAARYPMGVHPDRCGPVSLLPRPDASAARCDVFCSDLIAPARRDGRRGFAWAGVVGAALGVVAQLDDGHDVQHPVDPPAAGRDSRWRFCSPEEASMGAVPFQDAKCPRVGNRDTSPMSPSSRAAPEGPIPCSSSSVLPVARRVR